MVPLWLFITVLSILIVCAVALAILSYLHFVQNPLPFPDWGNAIFVCPTQAARKALFQVLEQHGLTPNKRVRSDFVDRAIFFNRFRFIVNVTRPEDWNLLGNPATGLALVVNDPLSAAQMAKNTLEQAGYSSQVFENPDADVPPGALAIVTSEALPHWVLVFRKHFTKMGPPPPAWKDEE